MNELERSLRRAVEDLGKLGVPHALVGGLAVSARAEPRLTRDADLAISVEDDAAAEAVVHALGSLGYAAVAVVEQAATGRLATARLVPPEAGSGLVVDLLFASCGIEREIVQCAERIAVLPDLVVPVATTGHLVAMKLLARDDRHRPNDADDLRALAAVAEDDDWTDAASAVALIAERGCARGRDLRAALLELRRRGAF